MYFVHDIIIEKKGNKLNKVQKLKFCQTTDTSGFQPEVESFFGFRTFCKGLLLGFPHGVGWVWLNCLTSVPPWNYQKIYDFLIISGEGQSLIGVLELVGY